MRHPLKHPALAAAALVTTLVLGASPAFAQGAAPRPGAGTPAERWRPKAADRNRPANAIPDTTVLLRVGPDAVNVTDFVKRYFNAYPESRPTTDSAGRVQFLRNVEGALLLRRAAHDRNRPLDFGERAIMREHTDRVLSNVLYQRSITDSTRVEEPELREMYSMLKTEIRLREVTFRNLAEAERVYDQLRTKKLTWEQAYARHHQLEKKVDLGDLGWVKRTVGEPTMVERIFRLQKGEMAPPWRDINGVHLVQCTDTRPGSPPPFDVIKARLAEIVRTPRVLDRTEAIARVLRERIGMVYDTTNIIWAAQKFEDNMNMTGTGGAPVVSLGQRLPSFAIADSGRVLARHKDGRLTMFQFIEAYRAIPPVARPAVNTPDRFRAQVDAIALEPYRTQLARERGYDKDPLAIEWIEKRRDELMVERLYADSVEAFVSASEEDVKRFYEANLPQYITYPAVTYAMWIGRDKDDADAMLVKVKGGLRLDEVIRADSAAGREQRGSVRLMRQNEEGTDFYNELFGGALKPGDGTLVGPDRDGKYVVLQMLDFDSGRQLSLAEAYRLVDDAVRTHKAEQLLAAFLDRLRRRIPVMSRPELVMRFAMVDPTI